METDAATQRFELHPGVLSRALDDELVLYHPLTDEVTHLDRIACVVWTLLEAAPTVDELVTTLAESFATNPDVVGQDVRTLLAQLQTKRLVRLVVD